MEQRKKLLGLTGIAFFFITLGGLLAVTTLLEAVGPQWQQWVKVLVTFVSFVAGILSIEMVMRISTQRFTEAFSRRERELGRSLSPEEREEVKRVTHATMANAKGPGFSAPLVRLIARVSLIVVPAILLSVVVAAIGAFFAGVGLALLFNAVTGRILDNEI
jgi:ABC-type multidrug transport system fused ATPase/permease subunit